MKSIAILTILGVLCGVAHAEVTDFSYNFNNESPRGFGYSKEETYDVAIKIDSPTLAGINIEGIEVPMPGDFEVKDPQIWLSTSLNLKKENGKNINAPDIICIEAQVQDSKIYAKFPSPYEIEGEIYAGYSFTVTSSEGPAAQPIGVAGTPREGGLYVHTTRTRMKWTDATAAASGVSSMKINLEGSFPDYCVSVTPASPLYGSVENESELSLLLHNNGLKEISSAEYEIISEDYIENGVIQLTETLPGILGAYCEVKIPIGHLPYKGDKSVTISINKVDSHPNEFDLPLTEWPLKVYPFIPINRPLVEEYTQLSCGWCPRGYVALEEMGLLHGDRFVGVAYHTGDPMACVEFPQSSSGLPDAHINRGSKMDPDKIYTEWAPISEILAPASIEVDISPLEDNQGIRANSKVRFIDDYNSCPYGIIFMAIADDLSNPSWVQDNYYSGQWNREAEMPGLTGKMFLEGPSKMFNLTFNDVIVGEKSYDAYSGIFPSEITAGDIYEVATVFKFDEMPKNFSCVTDYNNLRVVGVVVDGRTKRPVNSISSDYLDGQPLSDIEEIQPSECEITYYDLQGHKIACPSKGIFIRVSTDNHGDITTSKVVLR